jgi:ribonuclease P protein component
MRRRNRLASSALIRRVTTSGTKLYAEPASLAFLQLGDVAPPQLAVVASRRVGNAVDRNRARRRLRAALDHQIERVPRGMVGVVAARGPARQMNFQDLEASIASLLAKAASKVGSGA